MAASTQKKAVVLVSGGLDSTTVLALANASGFECYGLSFDYGQRHCAELDAARNSAIAHGAVAHKLVTLNLNSIGGSALTDTGIAIPESDEGAPSQSIPITYVPARNTVFLAIALGWAEVLEAEAIFIGVNAIDYSGYPDCRPEYISAFQTMANLATRVGVEGQTIRIEAPLLALTKSEIIRKGQALGVDYGMTVSCYQADDFGRACGRCDACHLRRIGFKEAGVEDPTRYQ